MATGDDVLWQVRAEKDDAHRRELSSLFKQLRAEAISNIEYFQNASGANNERFYSAYVSLYGHLDEGVEPGVDSILRVAHEYDFSPAHPYNGYRSIVRITHKCTLKLMQLTRYISVNRESFLFRAGHYSREIDAYVVTLGQLRACLYYLQKLLHYCPNGVLFPDEDNLSDEDYATAEQLMTEVESLSQETFYGRCLGFQYCDSMVKPLTTVNLVLASFSEGYESESSVMKLANSVLSSGKYLLDPELRAKQVVRMTRYSDIRFCKAFWSLAENELMHSLPLMVCPPAAVDRVVGMAPEIFDLPLADESDVARISPPCAHSGPGPVYARLISFEPRQGQEMWLGNDKKGGPRKLIPPSTGLIIHIHGGGFVAQSSASHEVYLRHWAKDVGCPILSIDYSLAPEAPFPRQLEEVFYAYCWSLANLRILGTTGDRICLAGDSAGGNLCVALAMRAASFGIRIPDGILSVYGCMLVKYTPSPSRMLALMDPLLPLGIVAKCLAAYAGVQDTASQFTLPEATVVTTPTATSADFQPSSLDGATAEEVEEEEEEEEEEPEILSPSSADSALSVEAREQTIVDGPETPRPKVISAAGSAGGSHGEVICAEGDRTTALAEGSPGFRCHKYRVSGDSGFHENAQSNEGGSGIECLSRISLDSTDKGASGSGSDETKSGCSCGTEKGHRNPGHPGCEPRAHVPGSGDDCPVTLHPEDTPLQEETVGNGWVEVKVHKSRESAAVTAHQGAKHAPGTAAASVAATNGDAEVQRKRQISPLSAAEAGNEVSGKAATMSLNLSANQARQRRKSKGVGGLHVRSPSYPTFHSSSTLARSPVTNPYPFQRCTPIGSPVSPSMAEVYHGDQGDAAATGATGAPAPAPTYAKVRHFAQSPVQYFRQLPIAKNPFMSPYLARDELLVDLCPIYFVGCNLDPMLDDTIQFAKRLQNLNKTVHVDVVDDLPHGFLNFVLVSREAKQASDLCVQRLCEVLTFNDVTDEEWDMLEANEGQ